MVKAVGYKQNWVEVAPARLTYARKSFRFPRLETILEEGCENRAAFSKKVFLVLPVALSTVIYFLLYKDVTLCA